MMKRYCTFAVTLLLLAGLLGGCQALDSLRERILSQGEKTVDSVSDQVKKTKESVEQKVKDVQRAAAEVEEAAKQVEEAINAVKKVTGEGMPATVTTGTGTQSTPPAKQPALSLE